VGLIVHALSTSIPSSQCVRSDPNPYTFTRLWGYAPLELASKAFALGISFDQAVRLFEMNKLIDKMNAGSSINFQGVLSLARLMNRYEVTSGIGSVREVDVPELTAKLHAWVYDPITNRLVDVKKRAVDTPPRQYRQRYYGVLATNAQ
jgi:hypothetical protein